VSRRGSALAQVLILAAVGGLIAARLIQARLQPSMLSALTERRLADDLAGQKAASKVAEVWARDGSCSSDSSAGVTCSGLRCSCRCDVDGTELRAVPAAGTGESCVVTVTVRTGER
jgi:hypothetical protein